MIGRKYLSISVRRWLSEYLAIDFVNESIYKIKKSNWKEILRNPPVKELEKNEDDFLVDLSEVTDEVDVNSVAKSGLTPQEESLIKVLPKSAFTGSYSNSMSPERKRYFDDLDEIQWDWLAECKSDGLYERSGHFQSQHGKTTKFEPSCMFSKMRAHKTS